MERVNGVLNIQYSNKKDSMNIQYSIKAIKSKRNRKGYSDKAAQNKAMYLADKFENPGGILFYLKCAWNLTDEYLDWLVGYSFKKKNAAKYFIRVADNEMKKNS